MNKFIGMGRLTKAPDVRYTGEQKAVARFTLAIGRRFKRDETDFLNCVAFGKQAEFCEKYLNKGTKVVVCGRIETGSYVKKDGSKVYTTEIVAEEIEFAESKGSETPKKDSGFEEAPDDEELPFL